MSGRDFTKGDKYRPVVTIKKVKGGIPTVLEVSGRRYVYEPDKYKQAKKVNVESESNKWY